VDGEGSGGRLGVRGRKELAMDGRVLDCGEQGLAGWLDRGEQELGGAVGEGRAGRVGLVRSDGAGGPRKGTRAGKPGGAGVVLFGADEEGGVGGAMGRAILGGFAAPASGSVSWPWCGLFSGLCVVEK
jgi:hypothetical protein